jgi:hypothetical protein
VEKQSSGHAGQIALSEKHTPVLSRSRGAPVGNRNGERHGIWTRCLSKREQSAWSGLPIDPTAVLDDQVRRLQLRIARADRAARRARLHVVEEVREGATRRTTRRSPDYDLILVRLERSLTRAMEAKVAAQHAGAIGGDPAQKAREINAFLIAIQNPFGEPGEDIPLGGTPMRSTQSDDSE